MPEPLVLPPGRFPATFSEVKERWGFNPHRVELIANFETFVDEIRKVIPVAAVWLSGSFLTEKETPGDVDAVFLIDQELLDQVTDRKLRWILSPPGLKWLSGEMGFHLDLYVLPWKARTSIDLRTPEDRILMEQRGYWDDFWQRLRQVPKGSEPTRQCALPSRGYLEVILDGFK